MTGKEYGLNLGKLMTRVSTVSANQIYVKDDRQFFCSELVAKSYKVLRLLKDMSKSCTTYYPASFEEGGDIDNDMLDGITLSQTYSIMVDACCPLSPYEKLGKNEH